MKSEVQVQEFKPVKLTITIETRQELTDLYAVFNACGGEKTRESIIESNSILNIDNTSIWQSTKGVFEQLKSLMP